jgi:hypothetical protein
MRRSDLQAFLQVLRPGTRERHLTALLRLLRAVNWIMAIAKVASALAALEEVAKLMSASRSRRLADRGPFLAVSRAR